MQWMGWGAVVVSSSVLECSLMVGMLRGGAGVEVELY